MDRMPADESVSQRGGKLSQNLGCDIMYHDVSQPYHERLARYPCSGHGPAARGKGGGGWVWVCVCVCLPVQVDVHWAKDNLCAWRDGPTQW